MSTEHQYGEGFKLMWYACVDTTGVQAPGVAKPGCGHRERIWNSRNGVTPFGVSCPSCGGSLLHVEWQRDEHAPGHKLRRHQRYFRDGTQAEALAHIDKMYERSQGGDYPMPLDVKGHLIAQVRDGTSSDFRPGWPKLCVHEP